MLLKKLVRIYKLEWTPRLCDLAGFAFLIAAVGLSFGLAPMLAATGVALLLVGWALS